MQNYEIIVETKELHRLESTANTEEEAIDKALELLNKDELLSNIAVSYNVVDIILKDEYL